MRVFTRPTGSKLRVRRFSDQDKGQVKKYHVLLVQIKIYYKFAVPLEKSTQRSGRVVECTGLAPKGCLRQKPAYREVPGVSKTMYFTYLLKSEKDQAFYYGHTKVLESRLAEHNAGRVRSKKGKRPWKIHSFEEFQPKSEAY